METVHFSQPVIGRILFFFRDKSAIVLVDDIVPPNTTHAGSILETVRTTLTQKVGPPASCLVWGEADWTIDDQGLSRVVRWS